MKAIFITVKSLIRTTIYLFKISYSLPTRRLPKLNDKYVLGYFLFVGEFELGLTQQNYQVFLQLFALLYLQVDRAVLQALKDE